MRLAGQVEAATVRYWTAMERHKLYISEHGQHAGGLRLTLEFLSTKFSSEIPHDRH
jgi:hypothetical protein